LKQVLASTVSNSEVMPGVCLLWLEASQIASAVQPGQFVMVQCGDEILLRRPLSVHRRDGNRLALLFNVVGKGTSWLSQCKAGDGIDLFGPMGNGFSISPGAKNLLLVAGGMGLAPLCFLAQQAVGGKCSVTLLYGTAGRERYSEFPQIELVSATEDGSAGYHGLVTDLLPDYIDRADQVFACGPLPMYKAMAHMPALKAKPVQVSLEVRMGCGFGACYGCTVKTKSGLKQVCKDGPVFDLDDVLWDGLELL
jgi:dihydroorotate dehydrogenase electron transfer subunit